MALLEEAAAAGAFDAPPRAAADLQPLELSGDAPAVDLALLARVAAELGPDRLAALVQAALGSVCLAVSGGPPVHQLVAAVLNCLPVECRTEFSFSTEMKFSSRRPFRIIGLPRDQAERNWLAHHANVTLLDLDRSSPAGEPSGDWARLIERIAGSKDYAFLDARLSQRRPTLTLEELPALGLQLCDELDASQFGGGDRETADDRHAERPAIRRRKRATTACGPTPPIIASRRARGARPPCNPPPCPRRTSMPTSPEVLEKLEALDDAVYDAIHGHPAALERLQALWPATLVQLGEQFVADSREQYLRYALTIWENCVDAQGVHDPARAVQALEVLCVLFDER